MSICDHRDILHMRRLSELPEDLLLEICGYLDSHSLLALSQTFKIAYLLSRSSPSWWWSDISASHLPINVRPITGYTAHDLRETALRARRTRYKLETAGSKELNFLRAPIESNHYSDTVAARYLFYMQHRTTSVLVCHDLRTGAAIGRFELPKVPENSRESPNTRCLAATEINHQTVLLSALSESGGSWSTPALLVIQVDIVPDTEEPNRVIAKFNLLLQTQIVSGWTPKTSESIRLPRWIHIEQGLVCWAQDIIDFGAKVTVVTPLLTVVRYQKEAESTEHTYKMKRWFCGSEPDRYTVAVTLAVDCILLVLNSVKPQLYGVPISTILTSFSNPGRAHPSPVFSLNLNQEPGPKISRFEFDPVLESVPLATVPSSVPTNASSRVCQLNMVALANNAASSDVWHYSILVHTYIAPSDNHIRVSLHMQGNRRKGSRYATYITRFGVFRGLTWCVTMSPIIALCLERDETHWPLLRIQMGDICLVDLKSGFVCAFSDADLTIDPSPYMLVTWF